jgi:hypothetical protein
MDRCTAVLVGILCSRPRVAAKLAVDLRRERQRFDRLAEVLAFQSVELPGP